MNLSRYFIALAGCLFFQACVSQENKSKIENHKLHKKIPKSEYSPQVTLYSSKAVNGKTALEVLENSRDIMIRFIDSIPNEKIPYKYGGNKWTVAQVLQHIIYYEEIMYEKMLIALGRPPAQLNYQYYTQAGTAAAGSGKSKDVLLAEFIDVRDRMIELISSLDGEELKTMGTMDGFKLSIRVFTLCASGHQQHHFDVIRNRYL
ncbi:DinB family protein [Flagellimonas sp. S174]|uniref:DinB family protein n=1 Tax=Flagellimonas sp. S174 TaxID=3410790 RepID=UPI003BF58851